MKGSKGQKLYEHPLWVLLCVASLTVIAWSGLLDGLSEQYLDGALLGSGAIYATARGINALVSVLQGTEMNAFVLTFTVGELLDPVNDLIERFSGVMMVALGSLALQKLLLEVVSDFTFNILLTAFGVGVIFAKFLGAKSFYRLIAKFFAVTVLIRFSLAAVVLANSWADVIFLQTKENQKYEAIKIFHERLAVVGEKAGIESSLTNEASPVEAAIARNQKTQESETLALSLIRARLEEEKARLNAIDKRSLWETLKGDTTANIESARTAIKNLEEQIAASTYTLTSLQEARKTLDEQWECLGKRNRGESCSLSDSLRRTADALNMKSQIEALVAQVDEFASNLIGLLMSLILKTIILPILFLLILYRSVRYVFL